jgi:ssDNA-binding Zn-finger/Zn-ribbon topoisomerase 1
MPLWDEVDDEIDEPEPVFAAGGARKFEDGMETELFCEDCGAVMIVRTNRNNGGQFLGCQNWPDCTSTRKIPESWIMKHDGQEQLL